MAFVLNVFEKHIPITSKSANEPTNALTVLSEHCELSKAEIKQAISKGALWLTKGKTTQRLRRIKKTLSVNDVLHFYYNEKILSQEPPEALLIEDVKDYSVWYKPYGMLSQGSKWSDHCTISRWAQNHLTPERPTFIVHRLDRAATGLIIVAHTKKTAQYFSQIFEKHALEKNYLIIINGNHTQRPQPDVINSDVDGKSALSTFTCIKYDAKHNVSLVSVKIDSGRKHQIRVHSASIGMPVVGDRLHGNLQENIEDRTALNTLDLQLCAFSLSFTCPVSENKKTFQLPEYLKPSLNNLCAKA